MRISVSIYDAKKIIEEHFKQRGYFINYDNPPIKFTLTPNPQTFGTIGRFDVSVSFEKSLPPENTKDE